MRSAESTGDEWPGGSAVRQMTFLAGPNSVGRPVASETPKALGPRNWGQSAAATRQGIAATSRMTGRRGIQTVYSAPNHSIRSAVKPGTCRTLLTKASIDPAAVRANHGSRADLLSLGLHWGSAQSGLSGCNAQRGNWNASTPRRFPKKHAFADPPRSRRLHRVAISRNRFAAARCVQNARRPQSHDNFGDRLV